jgi:hypothetical protein
MPAPPVFNSHFFSKFLLRNWESGKDSGKRVWFFDFDKDAIGNAAARSFLVSDTPFPDDVEKLLKDRIEDPLGNYVARSKNRQPFGLAPDPSPREDAAIALALSFQAARTSFAAGDGKAFDSARELLGSDERVAQVVAATHQNWTIIGGTVPETERLFLTSTGLFPVFCSTDVVRVVTSPTIGVGIPLHPRCFIAMVPHGKNADDLRQIIVEKSGMITAMSVGLRGHRVVIPPHYDGVTPPTRALADFAQLARSNNERLRELFERAQAAVALARRSASATPR